MTIKLQWADEIAVVVCQTEERTPEEKSACWYNDQDMSRIDCGITSLVKAFKKTNKIKFEDAESNFNQQGHSLRGLEPMKDCPMMRQLKIMTANRIMLSTENSKAAKISRMHAKAAYKRGLYDEMMSMCYKGPGPCEDKEDSSSASEKVSILSRRSNSESERKHQSKNRGLINRMRRRLTFPSR